MRAGAESGTPDWNSLPRALARLDDLGRDRVAARWQRWR